MFRIAFLMLLIALSFCSHADQETSLWSENKEAKAVCVNSTKTSCFIFIGNHKVDISQVENINLGKLGIKARDTYSKVKSFPSKWLKSDDGEFIVVITTEAWLEGELYTVSEPVYVKGWVYLSR